MRRAWGVAFTAARVVAVSVAATRLAGAARRRPPVVTSAAEGGPEAGEPEGGLTVVIPARNEAERIGPLLRALADDPSIGNVIVVDDESADGTAAVAEAAGAAVIAGLPLPAGWVGKPWALQQGLEVAGSRWVAFLDADTVPSPGLLRRLTDLAGGEHTLLTAGAAFVCESAGQRVLHPAMLTTLVYRFGPAGQQRRRRPSRAIANGQCVVVDRQALLDAGGFHPIRGHLTDDIALARHLAAHGWRVELVDATAAITVRMHEDARETWTNWGRSLPMADTTTVAWQAADLGVVWLAQALPLVRVLSGVADAVDVVALALRLGTLAGTRTAYRIRGVAYWCSPLADAAVAARLTAGAIRPGRTWRGRTYD